MKRTFEQVCDSANPLMVHLDLLVQRGWTCEQPRYRHTITGTDKRLYRCVYCEGLLFGVPRAIFLSVDCGRVMLIGEQRDVTFEEFLTLLTLHADPELAELAAATDRQRSLFD